MPAAPSSPEFAPLSRVPPPAARNIALRADRSGLRALRKGHPWLFEAGVVQQSHAGRAGDLGVVFDDRRRFAAIGLYDPHSILRLRVLHCGDPVPIDDDFFAERLAALVARRCDLAAGGTTGYRLVAGENEGIPGLIVDRYADTLVAKLYTPAWLPHLARVLRGLLRAQPAERIVLRFSRDTANRPEELYGLRDGVVIHGPELEEPIVFQENGLRFECDPVRGQKTGFFLDHRDNRRRVEGLADGGEVLNAFAYSGGFSLYAARGGATAVLSLDASRPALAAAERNFALNRSDPGVARARHETLAADAFDALETFGREGRTFDLVVLDPPAFAHKQSQVERALSTYERLARLGLGVLRPGGHIAFASCSAHVSRDAFFRTVLGAARRAGRSLDAIETTGHPSDHPVGFPEGEYLKCLFARAARS